MLKSRAITQCARDACEEVLFGLHYTPEELGADVDEDGVVVDEAAQRPADRSDGTPPDDPWYVRPAPNPRRTTPGRGTDRGPSNRPRAASSRPKPKRGALARSRRARQMRHQGAEGPHPEPVADWIRANRRRASDRLLRQLPESAADWKAAVEGLDGDDIEACRKRSRRSAAQGRAGTWTRRSGRIGRAIIALCPKAASRGDDDA